MLSVKISSVKPFSKCWFHGIKSGDELLSVDGKEVTDILDYDFYLSFPPVVLNFRTASGKLIDIPFKNDDTGLKFRTYLMDQQHHCKNGCIFCFIDQLPKGMRESLYFKDDDSRLSFLFGNYVTLTNITEHEVDRIIRMHISPINVSVHTTNPELRVKMMKNKNAGKVLSIIDRFNAAGIKLNCQLVLCHGYNDGAELERSLTDLCALENAECIAAVPVGVTAYREGLEKLETFNKETAGAVIDIIDRFGNFCEEKYGDRRVYAADEFYILAEREMPGAEYYGDFLQLENGVGMWALMKKEVEDALADTEETSGLPRKVSLATGEAAYPLIASVAKLCEEKSAGLECNVYAIKNEFFGGKITVSGLVTATDIIKQIGDKDLGDELLIPASMLRSEGDMFLDSITLKELSERLNIKITPVANDGYELTEAIIGTE